LLSRFKNGLVRKSAQSLPQRFMEAIYPVAIPFACTVLSSADPQGFLLKPLEHGGENGLAYLSAQPLFFLFRTTADR